MIATTLLLIASLLFPNIPDNSKTPRYDIKSGIIKMTMDMMGEQEITIYFDDYGARQAVHTSMNIDLGEKSMTRRFIAITRGDTVINYDPEEKTGSLTVMSSDMSSDFNATTRGFSRMSAADKKKYKYRSLKARTVLGKQTIGHQIESQGMTIKVWTWKEIALHMEMSGGQMPKPIIMKARSVETDVQIPAGTFEVPADVEIQTSGTGFGSDGALQD